MVSLLSIAVAAVAAAVVWLVLFAVFRIGPRAAPGGTPPYVRSQSPAVVSLLTQRPDQDGFGVTLLDLAARGWFRFGPPAGPPAALAGRYQAGPVMCALPAQTPSEQLEAYEQRVVAHVRRRVGGHGAIPAEALSDCFERQSGDGERSFLEAFRREVAADARARGLARSAAGWKLLLFALAVAQMSVTWLALSKALPRSKPDPVGSFLATHEVFLLMAGYFLYFVITGWFFFQWGLLKRAPRVRRTRAGRAALAYWRAPAPATAPAPAAVGRELAYAAALGAAPGVLAQLAYPDRKTAWSSYRGGWQLLTISDPAQRSWPGLSGGWKAVVAILLMPAPPILAVAGEIYLGGGIHTVALAYGGCGAAIAMILLVATVRWAQIPCRAEFGGQVIRMWEKKLDSESVQRYVAIDDGTRPRAWAFSIPTYAFGHLTPGTLVHVQVSPRRNKLLSLEPRQEGQARLPGRAGRAVG